MYCSVVQEQGSQMYQLFCDGTLNLVMDMCLDYWTGSSLEIIDGSVEDKIYDYYQTCIENDMQVVAFSYRPIRPGNHMKTLEMKDRDELPIYIEIPFVKPKDQPPLLDTFFGGDVDPAVHSRGKGNRLKVSADENPESFDSDYRRRLSSEEGKRFFEEVVKGQTFLGMAVLSTHHPKPNVGDFIEDVRLAGIRFVYFSPSPERETKGWCLRKLYFETPFVHVQLQLQLLVIVSVSKRTGTRAFCFQRMAKGTDTENFTTSRRGCHAASTRSERISMKWTTFLFMCLCLPSARRIPQWTC
jgi:hypothetical protein